MNLTFSDINRDMKRLFIINCKNISHYAFSPILNGNSAFQFTHEELKNSRDIHYISDYDLPGITDERQYKDINTEKELLDLISRLTEPEEDRVQIVWLSGLSPFFIEERLNELSEIHEKWQASFTFADGYPSGLYPEIINFEDISEMLKLAENKPFDESFSFFTVLSRNINEFDIESIMVKEDIRQLRVELLCNNKGNALLCSRFISKRNCNADDLVKLILKNQNKLMTLPYYYQIQINSTCPQVCSYCPYSEFSEKSHKYISSENFEEILKKISKFSSECHVSLSLWGEPALHPQILSVLKVFEAYPQIIPVVETSGIGWNSDLFINLSKELLSRILWIVSVDSTNPETYRKLRGPGFDEAVKFAITMNSLSRLYVQSVRMKSNNEELPGFLAFWEFRKINTIIQKYDSFAGKLPDLKIVDLQPVKRHACWHLRRELVIDLKGNVSMCREVFNDNSFILGNIYSDTPGDIWSKQQDLFSRQTAGHFSEICRRCDEYYTYNF